MTIFDDIKSIQNENKQSVAKKVITKSETTFAGSILEQKLTQIIRFRFNSEVKNAIELLYDDHEYAIDHGVFYHYKLESLYYIEVDKLIEELRCQIEDRKDQDDLPDEKMILEYILQFEGFDIWV